MSRKTAAPPEQNRPRFRGRTLRFTARWAWRGTKAVALLLLSAVLVGAAWVTWTNHRGERAAEDAAQLIEDRGSPPANPEPVADSNNGARFYLAAAELLALDEALEPIAPVFGDAAWPEFGDRVTNEQREILRTMVNANQSAFDLCRLARSFEQFDYGFRDPLDTAYNTAVFGKLRRLSRWITLKTYLTAAENDLVETKECLIDVFAISRSLNGGEDVLAQLVGLSISALAHGLTEETLSRIELGDDALAQVRDAAERSLNPEGLAAALESEARAIAVLIETPDVMAAQMRFNYADTMKKVEKVLAGYGLDTEAEPWWSGIAWRLSEARFVLSPGTLQVQGLEQIKYQFEAADRVRAGQALDIEFIEDAVRRGVEYAPSNAAAQRTQLKFDASLLTLLGAIDAERYRLRTGRWPTDMKELLNGATVPLDPWGHPLQILHTDRGIRVYSWGPNGQDDQARLSWRDDDAPEDADDEHTRLLDLDQRGKKPEPPSDEPAGYGELGGYGGFEGEYGEFLE